MENEIWKDVVGYEGLYQVSNLGRVKSLKRYVLHKRWGKQLIHEKILKVTIDKYGYVQVGLHKNGKQKTLTVHRLVCSSFIINPEDKRQVNHINGIKTDNYVENLEWCTQSENEKHAHKKGLKTGFIGETNPMAKLKRSDVFKIKYGHKNMNQRQIAKKYNVCYQLISNIKRNKVWKHI